MSHYTAALEALDAKYGRIHTVADWRRVGEKSAADLTDDDLVILEGFDGPHAAAAARARREQALNPAPPAPPAVKTKAAAPRHVIAFPDRLWDDDAPDPATAMAQWSDTYGMKAVPIALWHSFVAAGREKRQALEAKVAALEQELAALKAAPLLKDAGIWRHGTTYAVGDVVQFSGSPWVCTKAHTASGPTADHACWRLWVKSGKDGKDAR